MIFIKSLMTEREKNLFYTLKKSKNKAVRSFLMFMVVAILFLYSSTIQVFASSNITKGTYTFYGNPSAIAKATNGDLYYAFPISGPVSGGTDTKNYNIYKWSASSNSITLLTDVNSKMGLDQSNNYYGEISLVLDSNGILNIAFMEKGTISNGTGSYSKGVYLLAYNTVSNAWVSSVNEIETQTLPFNTALSAIHNYYSNVKIQLNSSGSVSVAYIKYSNSNNDQHLIVQTGSNSNSTWVLKDLDFNTTNSGTIKNFLSDSSGNLSIIYTIGANDGASINVLKAPYTTPTEVLNGDVNGYDDYGAVEDSTGKIYILYGDYNGGYGILSNSSGSWVATQIENSDMLPTYVGPLGDLAIDSNDNMFFIADTFDNINYVPTGYYFYGKVAGSNVWTKGITTITELNTYLTSKSYDTYIYPIIPSSGNLMIHYFDDMATPKEAGYITGAISDFIALNSLQEITPTTANFDKYTSGANYVDIPVTMTLSGNTLSSIKNGANTLVAGTDYIVSGSTVTINKTYLVAQSVGTTNLTFKFSAGADQSLAVTVADTTPGNSIITPTTGNFDKYTSRTNYVDIPVTMTLNGNTLSSIKNGANTLVAGTDYVVSGSTVTINKTYLASQSVGITNLTFKFSAGADQSLAVTVADTTPSNSIITPTTGNFDKYAGGINNVDIPVTMTLSGNTLSSITNGTNTLVAGTDYVVSGNTVTVKKEYLAAQTVGTTNLAFKFSAGADQSLAVTVADTTPASSTITPITANFDKYASGTNYVDIPVTMTLSGNTLSSIKNGTNTLVAGTDYIVSGNTVTVKKEYLAAQTVGTTNLAFKFSAGADQSLAVTVADTTPASSTITPITANFDKYASGTNYVDIPVTMTLSGNTLSSIKNGMNTLVAGTDYIVSGNTVTINKTYLAAQTVGTTNLTFKFSAGADQSLAVTVADITPSNSTITPITGNFDKYTSGANYVDIPVTMTLNGNTLSSVKNGTNTLVAGTDYVVSGSTVTINKTYLAAQGVGPTTLTFNFSAGSTQTLVITVADTTPASSTITPTTANFDKYASGINYVDIPVTMTLNGNTLSSIKNGTNTLVAGTDYVVSGSTVTINKTYLVAQPVGTTNLTFKFSAGADQGLAVTVEDTTPGNSIITPTTGNFDKYANGANYLDIPVTMTLNGNSLISIKNGTVSLIENIDYTTTGSAITIKKEYLATQAVGTTNLTFTFSAGAAKNLAIIINDTTVPAETTYTLTYIAGANGSITGITLQTVNSGASGTAVTAVPNTGYHFVNWSDGLTTVTRTDSNVTTSSSITANFAETSSSSGGHGSTSTSGGTASTPMTTTTVTGSVVDNKTGETVKGIPAQVTVAADGTKTVEVKSQESIVFKEPDGTKNTLSDLTKLSFSVPVTTNDGSTTTNNNAASITLKADGTIQVNGLANGTETKFSVTFDLGNGQKITIGSMAVKVASDGTVSLTSTLIDPYGIITDPTTGKAVAGANVTLYYANTDRNKAAGKIPGTVVPLPTIDGFKPNNNINPQVSDASGAYGFMVFPTSDYYIIATKDGYNKYTSPMISVEQEIVKWDFQMFPLASGVNRISGNGRVDTALEIAKASFKVKVPNVVLATATDYPDALAGSVLAYKLNAPILLVGSSAEDQAKVLDYIKANLDSAGTVYILGGTGAVSKDMETKITANGFNNINRIGGADRYETSLKIADAMKVATGTPIIIASGDNYPDALSVSSAATLNQYPILLVKGNEMPSSIMNEISLIKPSKVYIIGLQGAISDVVEAEVSQTGVVDKANVFRIGGANRFETSLEVAKYFKLGGKLACVATGNNFPDALAGSVYAAKNLAPIILVDKALSDNQLAYLKNNNLSGTTIFGGESAVSKDLEQQLSQLFGK